ncbi:C-type mannose receptor 2 [Plakobranchus ocellatus]|uniref:C-type mannose receptor 2 n=1 Tax=Plakobranchus ocellatus TaxID=259542 RepID=A0AAV4CTB8_9GAST|nr:C-type mannose receptor 2 [Plakobranchus ocellatus]
MCRDKYPYICEKPKGLSCTPGWTRTPSGEACVKIYDNQEKNWYDARQACRNASGDLVTIRDSTMSKFIKNLLGGAKFQIWIGLHKTPAQYVWLWLDGEMVCNT